MKKLLVVLVLVCCTGRVMASEGDSWNLRFSPVGLLMGMIAAEVDYKVTENVVVGPSFLSWNITRNNLSMSASGFGVQGAYYFNPVYTDSFYVGGTFTSFSVSASDTDAYGNKASASASGTGLGFKGGYHWFWDSFNLNLGLVASSSSMSNVQIKDTNGNVVSKHSSPGTSKGMDFAVGFTF